MTNITAPAARLKNTRSRITNGSSLLRNVDGRSADARRYRDLAMSFADELGGALSMSEGQKALVRQAAASIVAAERLHSRIVSGEEIDVEQFVRLTNSTTKVLDQLGIKASKPPALDPPKGIRAHAMKAAGG